MDMRFRPSRKNPSGRPWRRPINRPVKTLDPKKWKCALNYSFRMSAFSSPNPLYGLSQRPSNQGWLFHPKMPYTGNQDNFSAATGVHPNRFQHAFIQTQSMGASPLYPQTMFCILLTKQFLTGQRPTPQASPKGAFSAVGGNAWHVSERHA